MARSITNGLPSKLIFRLPPAPIASAPLARLANRRRSTTKSTSELSLLVVDKVAGRMKVMPGTGSNSTAEALRLTKSAERAGADAALQVAPLLQQANAAWFLRAFQNIGRRKPAFRSASTTSQAGPLRTLSQRPSSASPKSRTLRSLKKQPARSNQASQIINATNLTLLSGDDSLALPLLAIGGRGIVSVVGNIVPQDVLAMLAAFEAGDLASARQWHHKLFPLCRDMLGLSTNPIPVKAAMQLLGRDTGELRLPMTPLEPSEIESLRTTLTTYGLL